MNKLSAKKSLGQNFLKSQKVLNSMKKVASESDSDYILEIGPGKGALTEKLLETGKHIIAVELDDRMIPFLEEKFKSEIEKGKLQLIHGDILSLPIEDILKGKSYSLIANIPYYITNAIIRKFLEGKHLPEKILLLIQKEVADRIVARDGKESILSLSVQLYGRAKILEKVPKGFFQPSPKVDSALVLIDEIQGAKKNAEDFFKLIHTAFSQRRKQLYGLLKKEYGEEKVTKAFQLCQIEKTVRAEKIPLETWFCLLDILTS